MNDSGTKTVGNYRLAELLGSGELTQVYALQANRPEHAARAVKVLSSEHLGRPDFITTIRGEATLLSRLQHSNLPRLFEFVESPTEIFSVLERIEGHNLRDILDRIQGGGKKPSEWFAVYVATELLRTLDYVHRARDREGRPLEIVHGDIHPKNILIRDSGHVVLIDLTIAASIFAQFGAEPRIGKGLAAYMAPRQASGTAMDAATDLFSLGVVLFEMLCGRRPFEGATKFEVADAAANREITPDLFPGHVGSQLVSIVRRLLGRDAPYRDAAEAYTELLLYQRLRFPGLIPRDIAEYLQKFCTV